MSAFLLLILIQLSSGAYETKMFAMPTMEACVTAAAELAKRIPEQDGISYSLSCITVKSTTEQPA
jgi:hypothetical protein